MTARGILLSLALGALALSLSFAPFPFRFLAFFALIPLLRTIDIARSYPGGKQRIFLWSWFFGTLAAGFHFWWLWFLVVPVEPVTRFLLNIGVVVLFIYLGLYWAVGGIIVRRLGLWTAPLVWPLLEYLKSLGQIAFPWDLLGYAMTPWLPFIQPAAYGGVYIVSAWVVLVNLLCYRIVFSRGRLEMCGPGKGKQVDETRRRLLRPRIAYGVGLALTLLAPLVLFLIRVKPSVSGLRVAIVQPDVSPLDKGDIASREQIYADLLRLVRQAAQDNPDLIVCPETATLFDVTDQKNYISQSLKKLVDSLGIPVFTGTPLHDRERGTWHNGAVLLLPGEDSVAQRYYKMRLVPFSEKIPYADEFPLLRRVLATADMGNWDRGRDYTVFRLQPSAATTAETAAAAQVQKRSLISRFSGLICFEAIFGDLARQFVRRGAEMLVVVTNDGWFGRIIGAQQHAELAVMRSVEQGVPLVRSANNGISFIVDPYGRVLCQTGLFTQTILTGAVPLPLPPTFYCRFGDWFIVFCFAVIVIQTVVWFRRGRKSIRQTAQ